MTQMIALRRLRYAGKLLKPGSRFGVSKRQDVNILSLTGNAKEFVPEPLGVNPSARQPVSPSDRMTGGPADRMTGGLENPSEPEEISAPTEKPTRKYRRRDMKAEDV